MLNMMLDKYNMLGTWKTYSNVEMGERVYKQFLELEPKNAMGYVLCWCQTFVHLLATCIYLRILNSKDSKEVNLL